ncbi:MAG: response regulator [Calditrichaeota bacterium]|nr:MAG: response regulator [Calditrichota bacterium]
MKKILIIEDDPHLRKLYEIEITEMGFEVMSALNSHDALNKVRDENPQVVLLDLMLANMNGLDLLRDILSINSNLPVIINSAYPYCKNDFRCWGAEDFIVKSSDLSELKNLLDKY